MSECGKQRKDINFLQAVKIDPVEMVEDMSLFPSINSKNNINNIPKTKGGHTEA